MLVVDRVIKTFGATRALDDVSLDVREGTLTAVVGPSGSGKTTLLRVVAGLDRPDAGVVRIDGRDLTREPPERRHLAYVFQEGALFPHLDVRRNVSFGLEVRRLAGAEAVVRRALDLVGLAHLADRRTDALSGGERSRVALARALAPVLAGAAPRILLLDEPFSALDRPLREDLRRAIRALHRDLGLATVLVTHDREEALLVADRVVVLHRGHLVEEGATRDVYERPRTAFGARFLGGANVLSVEDAKALGGPAPPDGHVLVVPVGVVRAAEDGAAGTVARVVESGWASGRAVVEAAGVRLVVEDAGRRLTAGDATSVAIDWSAARALAEEDEGATDRP